MYRLFISSVSDKLQAIYTFHHHSLTYSVSFNHFILYVNGQLNLLYLTWNRDMDILIGHFQRISHHLNLLLWKKKGLVK